MKFLKKAYREIRGFLQALSDNSVGAFSAQAAFFVITSFFPFMLLMVTLVQFTSLDTKIIQESVSGGVLTTVTGDFVSGIIREATTKAAPEALLGAAGISAIWAASRCLLSIIQGLNQIYSVENKRSWLKLRLLSIAYVFALQIMLIVSLGILVFGEQVNNRLMLNQEVANMRWVLGLTLLILFFLLIYMVVPDSPLRKKSRVLTRLRQCLPGAVLSSVGWVGFSGLFSVYIGKYSGFGAVYGSLSTAVILMLWLYFCMYILFVGAQFNVWLDTKNQEKKKNCFFLDKIDNL